MNAPAIRRAFADLSVGQVHYACAGEQGTPAVRFLHQTPRIQGGMVPLPGQLPDDFAYAVIGFLHGLR
ncbi:hypothetical protein QTI66_10830 [Variovorax sp. J22R133]|uniref:hypothetical protein n=1 Tax=Variovorax brevis TaxID=3053503 RepID=UPI002576659A|nr:hypothetical protein [Variovorax sp. J22R133]MDM0112644.1 hypothetical protein [Variovorax sp. J22R133]